MTVLADLQRQGLVRHTGVSNALPVQVAEARSIAEVVCLQNMYDIAYRGDDAMLPGDGARAPTSGRVAAPGLPRPRQWPKRPGEHRPSVQGQASWPSNAPSASSSPTRPGAT